MRIYISGKITGNKNYLEEFANAEIILKKKFPKSQVFNPARIGLGLPRLTHEEYMRFAYLEMDLCDSVYFLPNWKDSKGALMEHGYALGTDMTILED